MWLPSKLALTRGSMPVAAVDTLLLDLITPQPTSALSTRKIRGAYTGPCMLVRRSSDNAEQDIGFVANELDVTSLSAFVGTGGTDNGFVRRWYDQSGNTRHAANATAADQPKIVIGGVVQTGINGIPSIDSDGVADRFGFENTGTDDLLNDDAYTIIILARPTAGDASSGAANFDRKTLYTDFLVTISLTLASDAWGIMTLNSNITQPISYPSTHIFVARNGGPGSNIWLEGNNTGVATPGNLIDLHPSKTGEVIVGSNYLSNEFFVGSSCEFLFFDAGLSNANLNTLGANIAARGGLTWTNI